MSRARSAANSDRIAREWLAPADRQLLYFSELYRSGRWTRYCTSPEQFAAQMHKTIKAVRRRAGRRRKRSASGGMMTWLTTLAAALLAVAAPAAAQDDLQRGAEILTRNCAKCHAVGRGGASADKEAPPFRILGQRYPIESLEEALGEGIMSGHPDMPEFKFDADDVGAIIDYLKSIQQSSLQKR
jgi:mono/diheme cytochrome c family protein